MKKILITSGGTKEYIDGVRVLTNISSGKLGATIADTLSDREFEIHFVYVKGSEIPNNHKIFFYDNIILYEVTDVKSVYEAMEKLVPEMDVVIHPMAVSDFGFKPISTKLKSNDTEAFIESMRHRIFKNPKILSHIKEWNPKCFLISFKFEDGTTHDELVKIASESQRNNGSDIVICNDKKEMTDKKAHIAYFIKEGREIFTAHSKDEIAEEISKIIDNI
jgi:phosphopantothenate--cysteine ligase